MKFPSGLYGYLGIFAYSLAFFVYEARHSIIILIFAFDMRNIVFQILLSFFLFSLVACSGSSGAGGNAASADSLCLLLADCRYRSVERLDSAAKELLAMDVCDEYNSVATASIAYSALMRMDYHAAKNLYIQVRNASRCEIEKLVADVGLMTLCYRVSANRKFFDYRTSAWKRICRIAEEEELLAGADRVSFVRAKVEFGVVSLCYFSGIGLLDEAQAAREYLLQELDGCDDVALRSYARMMLAAFEPDAMKRAEAYALGVNVTRSRGLQWLSANYKLLLAITVRGAALQSHSGDSVPAIVGHLNTARLPLGEFALSLAADAANEFSLYGDDYMKIEALAVKASCHTQRGVYGEALAVLDEAVAGINDYYRRYSSGADTLSLSAVVYSDDSDEEALMSPDALINVPECLLSIRREASCAYAGLGDKTLSDINREAYLDLLRTTRMNKQMESRLQNATDTAVRLYWWALAVVISLIVVAAVLYYMNRRWHIHDAAYTSNLKRLLNMSHSLMSSLPRELGSESEVYAAVCDILAECFAGFSGKMCFSLTDEFVPCEELPFVYGYRLPVTEVLRPCTLYIAAEKALDGDGEALVELSLPYISVAVEEGLRIADILDERSRLEEQRLSHELYLAEYKRENLLKRVSVSIVNGMRPYMDRMLNELRHLSGEEQRATVERRLQYVGELAEKLNDYNLILERWIKMRRGELNLLIENFSVRDILDIIGKSEPFFEARGIKLDVRKCDAVVRADRALTLFMLNTLVDNAGKFTPAGGSIVVEAQEGEGYVELSVTDSGIGLSQSDVERILGEKVYDASLIGDSWEPLSKNKGGGFGLMNCKGIIEKYRRSDDIFSVCRMDVSSNKGKGSRFSFRLLGGVVRCILLLLAICLPFTAFADGASLERAGIYADSLFLANVNGNYDKAFGYAEKAVGAINSYYKATVGGTDTLTLSGDSSAELMWWREALFPPSLNEDIYFNILDVRNELAVAALATKRWSDYRYNNNIYVSLYRLVHEDRGLDEYYYNMQQLANYRQVAIAFILFLIVVMVAAYLIYYVRHGVIGRMNSRMVLNLNRRLLDVTGSAAPMSGRDLATALSREILAAFGEAMCIERVSVMLNAGSGERRLTVSLPERGDRVVDNLYMRSVCESGETHIASDRLLLTLPLTVTIAGEKHLVGALEFASGRPLSDNEVLNIELAARYTASVAYHSMVRMAEQYKDLATMEEETERVKFEEHRLHVQNMVLDNCMSVIKHETLYYPSRIQALVKQAIAGIDDEAVYRDNVSAMSELMDYYSSIFGILSNCASKQLDEVNLHCAQIDLCNKFKEMCRFVERKAKKKSFSVVLNFLPTALEVNCDEVMLTYLLELLLDAALSVPKEGELLLRTVDCGDVVRVELLDKRLSLSKEELSLMFVPSKNNITPAGLTGMEYLVAKEIVRLHEDNLLQRGSRIEARSDEEGVVFLFTMPKQNIL